MAGHSKWSTIKHKKAKEDAKRGKAFTKIIKEITVCARTGGGDPEANARLRLLLEKGKEINMPQENATRAIKRGTGELPGVNYEQIMYEGYGPNNIAVVVEALTDNKNRTVAELRRLFSSHGGTLGESGSVSWMFERKGVVRAEGPSMNEDELIEQLLDYDVDDIQQDNELVSVFCDPKSLEPIKAKLIELGFNVESADIEFVAKNSTELSDADGDKAYNFLGELEDHEDIQNVFTNLV